MSQVHALRQDALVLGQKWLLGQTHAPLIYWAHVLLFKMALPELFMRAHEYRPEARCPSSVAEAMAGAAARGWTCHEFGKLYNATAPPKPVCGALPGAPPGGCCRSRRAGHACMDLQTCTQIDRSAGHVDMFSVHHAGCVGFNLVCSLMAAVRCSLLCLLDKNEYDADLLNMALCIIKVMQCADDAEVLRLVSTPNSDVARYVMRCTDEGIIKFQYQWELDLIKTAGKALSINEEPVCPCYADNVDADMPA